MAYAKNDTVERYDEDPVVVLTLTPEEAWVLYRLCGFVGGAHEGPRRHVTAIRKALGDVEWPGVEPLLTWRGGLTLS